MESGALTGSSSQIPTMPYELREHTADVAVEATGESMAEVFASVADGMAAAMCEDVPETGGERFDLEVSAEGPEQLLFDYLDELIYQRDVRSVLPVDNEVTIDQLQGDNDRESGQCSGQAERDWAVRASARGVDLSRITARDLKAVTYSEMDLSERADSWHAYVVFDV